MEAAERSGVEVAETISGFSGGVGELQLKWTVCRGSIGVGSSVGLIRAGSIGISC